MRLRAHDRIADVVHAWQCPQGLCIPSRGGSSRPESLGNAVRSCRRGAEFRSCRPTVPGDHPEVESEGGGLRSGQRATGECLPAAPGSPYRPTMARCSREVRAGRQDRTPVCCFCCTSMEIGTDDPFAKATGTIWARCLEADGKAAHPIRTAVYRRSGGRWARLSVEGHRDDAQLRNLPELKARRRARNALTCDGAMPPRVRVDAVPCEEVAFHRALPRIRAPPGAERDEACAANPVSSCVEFLYVCCLEIREPRGWMAMP